MHRLIVVLLALALAGGPEAREPGEDLGSQPGKLMKNMKGAAERASDEAKSRLDDLEE